MKQRFNDITSVVRVGRLPPAAMALSKLRATMVSASAPQTPFAGSPPKGIDPAGSHITIPTAQAEKPKSALRLLLVIPLPGGFQACLFGPGQHLQRSRVYTFLIPLFLIHLFSFLSFFLTSPARVVSSEAGS